MGVFFAHVPKTGGTSMQLMLGRIFPEDEFPRVRFPLDFDALSQDALDRAMVAFGHFAYPQLKRVRDQPGRTWVLVTMLREPRAQAISRYRFINRKPHHIWHQKLAGKSFGQALGIPVTGEILANGQTTFLNDVVVPVRPPLAEIDPARILGAFDLVGDTSHLNVLYLRLCVLLRRDPSDQIAYENVDPERRTARSETMQLTDEEERLLHELSFLDRPLYALGRERAEREATQFISELGLQGMEAADFTTAEGFRTGVIAVRKLLRE